MQTSQTRLDRAGASTHTLCAIHRPPERNRRSSSLLLLMFAAFAATTPASAQALRAAPAPAVVVEVVRTFIGLPYRLGGESGSGIDCSALVQRTFRAVGLELPRTAAKQFRRGCAVAREELMAGDLVFFHGRKLREISHVGIYIGGGRFIHAARQGVVVASLQAAHWARRFAGARRMIEEAPVAAIDMNFCIDGEEPHDV